MNITKQASITMADLKVVNGLIQPKLERQLTVPIQWHNMTFNNGYTRLCTCRKFTCQYVLQTSTCKFGGDSGRAYNNYLREKYSLFENLFNKGVSEYCTCGKHCRAMKNKEHSCEHGGSLEPFRRFQTNIYLCM
jgi:hypothetical protein